MISHRSRCCTTAAKALFFVALILAAFFPGDVDAQEPLSRSWLPLVTRDCLTCDVGPRVNVVPIVEPGVSVRYTRWLGCSWSEVQFMQTYMDEAGVLHNTYSLPIDADRWYYTPRWQVWRGGQWVAISEAEAVAVRDSEVVRMYVSVQLAGQNYTHQAAVGRQ